MQYIYTQNQFLPADQPFITAEDRSFRFGDGIFETMLVVNGGIFNFAAHLARLKQGLSYFSISLDVSQVEKECEALLAKNNCTSGYVRIVVSRGEDVGAMGYLMSANATPYYVLQTIDKPFPAYRGIALWVSQTRAHIAVPCKINSAMHYTLSMLAARQNACDNALILNTENYVCETASGNIFWVKDNVLYTPEVGLPFVPGTIRRKIITHSPLPVKEGRYTLDEMLTADEIFMTNVGGLVTKISSIAPVGYAAKNDAQTQQYRALVEKEILALR